MVIVGGGLGGLSAAITLANNGFEVTVYEKNDYFGGKMMPVQLGAYAFDFGPNTITMPDVFHQVIEQTGVSAHHYFTMEKLHHHTRNVFEDGTEFVFSSDPQKMIEQLQHIDPYGAEQYPAFINEITKLYTLSKKYFFPKTFQSFWDYVSPSLGTALLRVHPFQTMDSFFRKYFSNEHVIQAMNRYATYIGSSPYVTPATFAMIAYLELVEGVFYVKGGSVKIAEGFVRRAQELGVHLIANTEVKRLHLSNQRIKTVELANGSQTEADYVIMNGDLLTVYPKLVEEPFRPSFPDRKIQQIEPSISAFVLLVGLDTHLPHFAHHNVFFSANYEKEFQEMFQDHIYSEKPTIYICNSSVSDRERSPEGDNLFILVNAPPLPQNGQPQMNPEAYKEQLYDILETKGIPIRQHLVEERIITSKDIASQFYAFRGALYGLASHRKRDAFLRPPNGSKDIPNLFFTGGSTHPGGGSPMVVMSGQQVAKRIASIEK